MSNIDNSKEIYFDNAATTSVSKEVLSDMLPYFSNDFGNPSSLYGIAQVARNAVDKSREDVAAILNCKPSEIVFTSGGTEADNMGIIGVAKALSANGNHLITSKIEHHAVIHSMEELESLDFEVDFLNVNKDGLVNLDELENKIGPKTTLISIMYANNEIGSIQDIKNISKLIKQKSIEFKKDIYFHTDAVQAPGKLDLDVKKLGVDMLSLSAHKINGPKGVGCLYLKKGTPVTPLIVGGGQERQRRSGTENVPGIVGFAKALSLANQNKDKFNNHCEILKNKFLSCLGNLDADILIASPSENCLSNIVNLCFKNYEGEPILIGLDMAGICASSGSACSSASLEPSHVLLATGIDPKIAVGSVRFSFSLENSQEEIIYLQEKLNDVISELKSSVKI